uniref:Glycosyltransferase RgtA/B/C/D-like domain-containing protein n=1 Tax=Solibacter usitatus (strain Ellin6076) TaxID=234267 RepID=Q027F0_SOLUE
MQPAVRESAEASIEPLDREFPRQAAVVLAVLGVSVRLFFWFYTGRTWEDALITLQHAENAARGLGLTHTPQAGPPLHGFTSPLSVLIPLVGELIHRGFGLTLLRLLSAFLGGVSVWLGMRIAHAMGLAYGFVLLVGGYIALEHQQILYGMAGMETQVVLTILLFSFHTLLEFNPNRVGIGLGLAMLGRPDMAFWVGIVFVLIAWRCRREKDYRPAWIALAWLAVLYGPWLAFTTWYYGSPVPNTIVAKALGYDNLWYLGHGKRQLPAMIWSRIRYYVFGGLGPAYGGNGTGFQLFADGGAIACGILLLMIPGCLRAWRRKDTVSLGVCAFALTYSLYYLFAMNFSFGWYVVPLSAAIVLVSASGADLLLRSTVRHSLRRPVSLGFATAYLFSLVLVLPMCIAGDRHVQQFVEDGSRRRIGEYLASVAAPDQTVGCEPLGYVGYYSRLIVYDFPGLCSRKVTEFMRTHRGNHGPQVMWEALEPDYLVLRPHEIPKDSQWEAWVRSKYELVREFRVPEARAKQMLYPELNIDRVFSVFKHKAT